MKNSKPKAGLGTTGKVGKTKLAWDFSDLYSGPTDPKLAKDVADIETAFETFARKYAKDDSYLTDEKKLAEGMRDLEIMTKKVGATRPIFYLHNLKAIDSQNKAVSAGINKFEPILIEAGNKVIFFSLKLAKVAPDLQKKFLASPLLANYSYFLKMIFDGAKYNLAEDVEQVVNLKSTPARSMWVDGFQKLCANQTVTFKKEVMPLSKAMSKVHQLPAKDRHALHVECMKVIKAISHFYEAEINAVYTNKKIDDKLRGYEKPYSETILGYQNDIKNIEMLVKTVTEGFAISHKFYRLKAKALKLKNLTYADRAVGIGANAKKVPFEESLQTLRSSFGKAGSHYVDTLEMMLANGRIDVYPKKGKQGGAYCWGGEGVPTVVMLNYADSMDDTMTFAHEMGHAIHTELSKAQPPLYEHYTISVAEVASTFFENLAFEEMFEKLSDKEKIVALYDRIADYIQTIFRQIACFNFELDVHNGIREKGSLSAEEIGALHNKNMSMYMGPVTKFTELDGYFAGSWPHIRNFFYVYSYAYGALISRSLYKKCKEDASYFSKVDQFMKSGQSMSPEDIFKSIGVDVMDPSFYKAGLDSIKEDIDKLEKLMKKAKMI
ncbi:MAG TPA: M3 family metallopeptidase [Candidatus Paceibacterota bacterium]